MALISGEAFEHLMQGKAQSEQNDWDTNNGPEGFIAGAKARSIWRRARIDVVKGGNEVIVGPQFRIDEYLRTRLTGNMLLRSITMKCGLETRTRSKFDI